MPRKGKKAKAPKAALQKSKYATAKRFFDRAPKAQARNNKIEIGKGSTSMVVGAPPPPPAPVNTDA
jgi:hypothetical protein